MKTSHVKSKSCPASHHQNTEPTHTSYLAHFAFGFLHCHPVSSLLFVYLLFLLLLFMVNSAGEEKEKNTTVNDGGALVLVLAAVSHLVQYEPAP